MCIIKERRNYDKRLLNLVLSLTFLVTIGLIVNNASADTMVNTIHVGNTPEGVGVNDNTNMIYVGNSSGSLSNPQPRVIFVVSGDTNTVESKIPVGGGNTINVGINSITNKIYTANPLGSSVSVIDGSTNAVVNTMHVGNHPGDLAVNPNTNKIYLSDQGDGIDVIDGVTNNVVSTVKVDGPRYIAVNSNENTIYVTNSTGLFVVDGSTNGVVSSIPLDCAGYVAINPSANTTYVSNACSGSIYVINDETNTVTTTISVGNDPSSIGVNPITNKIYVANEADNTVSVIDGTTNAVVNTIQVGACPEGIGENLDTGKIYVTNTCDGTLSIISESTNPNTTSLLTINSQDISDNAITGFYTELYANNGTQLDTGYTPYNFTLDNGRNYTVHVENYGTYKFSHWLDTGSTNASRDISISSDQSITAVYATIPTHPTNLTATAVSSSEIDLNWNTPASDGGSPITGYRIQISTDDSTWTTIVKNTGNTSTAYNDTGLSDNTTYYYRVFALNSVGSSYRSNIADATTPILTVAGTNVGPVNTSLP